MTTNTLSDRLRIDIADDGECTVRDHCLYLLNLNPQEAKNLYLALYQFFKHPAADATQMTTVLGKTGPAATAMDAIRDFHSNASYLWRDTDYQGKTVFITPHTPRSPIDGNRERDPVAKATGAA